MEVTALRCTTCGAPLPRPQPGEEWIKCEYCGFLNKIVDASKYMEKLKKDFEKWIREILPPTVATSTTVDLAARHQIFQNIVKPKLALIKANMKAKYLQYMSTPLFPIPPPKEPGEESKFYFEEALKVQSIRDIAVAEEDVKFVNEILFFSNTTGYLVNALKSLSKYDVRSALKNIEEALNNTPDDPSYSLVKQRLNAVKTVISALQQIYDRNTLSAVDLAKTSIELYNGLLAKISSTVTPEVNKGIVEVEKTIAEAIYNIAEASHRFFTAGKDPLEVVKWVETYMKVFPWLRDNYKRPIQDVVEVTSDLKKFIYAKTGSPDVLVLQGKGSIYVPFHIVECRVSYAKGLIFKKGSESKLTLLVSSVVPFVEKPVLDVFGLYSGRMVQPDKVEESPLFSVVREVVSWAKASSVPEGAKGFPPLITSILAESIADGYIGEARVKYGGKITFASTRAAGLVYIPFTPVDQRTLIGERELKLRLTSELNNLIKLAL